MGVLTPESLLLYLVTDSRLSLGRPEEEVVRRSVEAGVTAVQYREKGHTARAMTEKARGLSVICREKGVPFFVNDRVDVALECGADGVHLGQEDTPLELARRMAGDGLIIGMSVRNAEEAIKAHGGGADYLAANGVFPTSTKTDLGDPIGLDGLRRICSATPLPVVAIGGITDRNAREVVEAGAAGVAVVSFIVSSEDIEGRCSRMLSALKEAQ